MFMPRMVIAFSALLLTGSILNADEIVLQNGDQLQGKIISTDHGKIVFKHDVLGILTLSAKQITRVIRQVDQKQIKQTPPPQIAPVATLEQLPETAKKPTWVGRFRKDWDSQFEAGASAKRGNTDNANIYLRFKTTTNKNNHKWQIDAAYYRDQSNSALTQNEFTASLRHEWLFENSPWAFFTQGRYDYDDFESWDQRVNGALGVEYQWLKKEAWDVKLNWGVGVVKEFGSNKKAARPELLAGINLKWKITKNQKFTATSTIFPELAEVGEFRVLSNAQWVLALNTLEKVSLKIGLINEYQSNLGPSFKKNDLKLYSALVFKF